MSDYNNTGLQGRFVKDPELQKTKNGKSYCKFAIANNDYAGEKIVNFFDCIAWGATAENIAKHFSKGKSIIVNGKLKQNRWENDGKKFSRVELNVFAFHFVGINTENNAVNGQDVTDQFKDTDGMF